MLPDSFRAIACGTVAGRASPRANSTVVSAIRRPSTIAFVAPIRERPVEIDRRFVALHQKCAAGTILPDELAELEMIEAMKIEGASK